MANELEPISSFRLNGFRQVGGRYLSGRRKGGYELWQTYLVDKEDPQRRLKVTLWNSKPKKGNPWSGHVDLEIFHNWEYQVALESQTFHEGRWYKTALMNCAFGRGPDFYQGGKPATDEEIIEHANALGFDPDQSIREARAIGNRPLLMEFFHTPELASRDQRPGFGLSMQRAYFLGEGSPLKNDARRVIHDVIRKLAFKPTLRQRLSGLKFGGAVRSFRRFQAAARKELGTEKER
jgi:hypothetical protein